MMQQDHADQSIKKRKAFRVSRFLDCGPLPVKDICGIILDYSQHFEGEHSVTYNGHTGQVTDLITLPNGNLASASWDTTVRVWDVRGTCLLTLAGHTDWVVALAVLPDGKLASGSYDGKVRVWEGGMCLLTLDAFTSSVCGLAVMSNCTLVARSDTGKVRVWC